MTTSAFTRDFCCGVIELRQYTLKPGQRETLIELFERHLLEPQESAGMTVVGQFRDRHRDDRFVWVRGFPDMKRRQAALERFYDGPVWAAHRDAANATMIDSDDVLLLKPARPDLAFQLEAGDGSGRGTEETLVVVGIYSLAEPSDLALVSRFEGRVLPVLAASGVRVKGVFVTESARNTFRLPVREGENALVWFGALEPQLAEGDSEIGRLVEASSFDGLTPVVLELSPTSRSRLGGGDGLASIGARGSDLTMDQQLFVVIRSRGSAWQDSRSMESQVHWGPHASFMNALEREGFVVLGGPLEGTSDVLLVVRAKTADEVLSRLAQDPWTVKGLLRDSRIAPWTLRLGALP